MASVSAFDSSAPPSGVPGRRSGTGLLTRLIVIGVAIFLGAFAVNLVRGSLSGGGDDRLAAAIAGELWDRLAQDVRAELTRRAETAIGDEELDPQQAPAVVQERVRHGLRRLDDETLVRRLALQTAALGRADEATCAAFAAASFAGTTPSPQVAGRLIAALDDAALTEWMRIAMSALEAETRGSPPPRSVPAAESEALFGRLFAGLDPDRIAIIQTAAAAGATQASACDGARVLYRALDAMPAADRTLAGLVDVTP
jgi:hypothetical protein